MRCDWCGRFYSGPSHDVWANPPQNGIDYVVCGRCEHARRAPRGRDLSGMTPPAIHIVDGHEDESNE